MKRLAGFIVSLALVLTVAGLAQAGQADKVRNTLINATVGYVECPKACADEASRGGERSVVGLFITCPLMCGTNVAVRYFGVAADLLTLPVGDNIVRPNALDAKPPVRLP